tara:strand:- start:2267 stop:2686 length:420 start_codon:yes stop_codon:yes gene_type:complete
MSLLGVGSIIEAVGKIAGDLITTDKERLEMEVEQRRLDLEEKRINQATDLAQLEVNKEEAKSSSFFVSGWRPFIGWGCGIAFIYSALIEPICRFVAATIFLYNGSFPVIDSDLTMQVMLGMLGLGAMRSYEKKSGVASK